MFEINLNKGDNEIAINNGSWNFNNVIFKHNKIYSLSWYNIRVIGNSYRNTQHLYYSNEAINDKQYWLETWSVKIICTVWYAISVLVRITPDTFVCIVQYFIYHNMDIGTVWHCTLVSSTPSKSIGLFFFLVCVGLVLSVIMCSFYYFHDRILFHHDFHHDSCHDHRDLYGH